MNLTNYLKKEQAKQRVIQKQTIQSYSSKMVYEQPDTVDQTKQNQDVVQEIKKTLKDFIDKLDVDKMKM